WERGRALLWDFTCADTFAPSHLPSTSTTAGAAASTAEVAKRRKYAHLEDRFHFVPVAVETTGVFGEDGFHLLEKIGAKLKSVTFEKKAASYLWQRMSMAIQRGNVASILNT